jgi:hypothetical protein
MSAAPAAANMHTTQSSAWDGCDRLSLLAGRKAACTEQMPASARACATCIAVATPGSSACVAPASSSSARANRVASRVATRDAADLCQDLSIPGVYSGHASRGSSPYPVAVRAVPAAALILFAHGARDLPATVEAISAALPGFTLDVQPPLGESPEMREAIVDWLARM